MRQEAGLLAEGLDDDGPFRDLSSIPEYVDDAIRSVKVTHLRIEMESQEQTPILNTADIEQATKIRMPGLPRDWELLDAQVYPSETGPSISVLMETPRAPQTQSVRRPCRHTRRPDPGAEY